VFFSLSFLIPLGWKLNFELDAKLDSKTVKFYCNHPIDGHYFNVDVFNQHIWLNKSCTLFPDSHVEINIIQAGVFKFYLQDNDQKYCQGCFIVQPELYFESGESIDIQSVTMQTVLAKCLGKFEDWKERLQVAHECNYNTVHFTPIQELGGSNSSYSIRDHHALDPRYGENFTETNLNNFISTLHRSWNMFSIVDVVWNHVSFDCKWILQHPEASYNLVNTTHLRPAFLVDRLLYHFNREISESIWRDQGVPNYINSDFHLDSIAKIIRYFLSRFLILVIIFNMHAVFKRVLKMLLHFVKENHMLLSVKAYEILFC